MTVAVLNRAFILLTAGGGFGLASAMKNRVFSGLRERSGRRHNHILSNPPGGGGGFMSRATPTMRGLAEQLIGFETRGRASLHETKAPAAAVCEKLRPVLGTLIGSGGFRGLLSRALVRATIEAP